MWLKFIKRIALMLFKTHILPEIKTKSHKLLNNMSDKVIASERNPISVETVGDIRRHADAVIDELFEEFE